jgi:D-lactate dehydrogenase
MLIALVRNLKRIENRIKNLNFSQDTEILGRELTDLTLGVIGTSRIGSKLALYGLAFGMKVLCYNICEKEELKKPGVFIRTWKSY